MIYTCTLNPSLDHHLYLENVELGSLNRTNSETFQAGGKGINVSAVLNTLSQPSTALGYAGGFTGEYIKQSLTSKGIQHDFIETIEPTRMNVKVHAGTETELNSKGPAISDEHRQALLDKIASLQEGDFLVLAGSIPPNFTHAIYEEISAICAKKGISFFVDATGDALTSTFSKRPFAIKPNHHELGELLGKEINTTEEAINGAKELLAQGVQRVLVSLGGDGAVFVTNDGTWTAKAPVRNVINTVGAGDSMVAGFLYGIVQHLPEEEAFKLGVACGSATAFSEGLASRELITELLQEVTIQKGV